MDFVLQQDIVTLEGMIEKAKKEERRKEAHDEWTALLPYMTIKWIKEMKFSEYLDRVTGANIDLRPTQDILDDVTAIRAEMERK